MRILPAAVAFLALLWHPGNARGQGLLDLLEGLRQGGGWVSIPIEGGRGAVLTRAVPTAGLAVEGCMQVWGGHSGHWDIRALDTYRDRGLVARVASGEPVPFSHETGAWARLDVEVRWSEPRDTTLLLWVGVKGKGRAARERDPCRPVYQSPGPGRRPQPPALSTARRSPTSGWPFRFPRASR